MSEYRVIEFERARNLGNDAMIALNVEQNIVRFVGFVNWVCQLTPTPVFIAVNCAA